MVTINVSPVSDAPLVSWTAIRLNRFPAFVDFAPVIIDADGDSWTLSLNDSPQNLGVAFTPGNPSSIRFTPSAAFVDPVTYRYTVTDSTGLSTVGEIELSIQK